MKYFQEIQEDTDTAEIEVTLTFAVYLPVVNDDERRLSKAELLARAREVALEDFVKETYWIRNKKERLVHYVSE